jgi:hypothetical protein
MIIGLGHLSHMENMRNACEVSVENVRERAYLDADMQKL